MSADSNHKQQRRNKQKGGKGKATVEKEEATQSEEVAIETESHAIPTDPSTTSSTATAATVVPVDTPTTPTLESTPKQYIGSIDQGTSSTRFILFDQDGNVERIAQQELKQITIEHHPGWAEHDPIEIMASIDYCIRTALTTEPPIHPSQVLSIGITNQRETTVAWDKTTGKPLHNAIVWHDTRTVDLVAEMSGRYQDGAEHFRTSAGLPISTYFSALKMKWLINNVPAVSAAIAGNNCLVGTIDSWVIWNLSGGAAAGTNAIHVTDVSNASRTMLMNINTLQWDETNCKEFGIPISILPTIRSNSEIYTKVFSGPLQGVPIAGCVGDQQAAMIGQLCFKDGQAKSTYGTGCFMLMNTGTKPVMSSHGLLTTVCFQLGTSSPCIYALEGSVSVAGSGVRWLRDSLHIIKDAKEINTLAATVADANDVYFVPAFSGLLSPYWRDDARGVITGLTHSSNNAHLARAVLYSSAYQAREVFDAMQNDTKGQVQLSSLQVDGGMCASDILMQFQADMLNIPVVRPASLEASASGAAFCAGLAVGFWPSVEQLVQVMSRKSGVTRFQPKMIEQERTQLYAGWKRAVTKSFGWIEHKQPTNRLNTTTTTIAPTTLPILATSSTTISNLTSSPTITHLSTTPTTTSSTTGALLSSAPRRPPIFATLATLATGVLIGAGLTVLLRPNQKRN